MDEEFDWGSFGYPSNIRPFPDTTQIWAQGKIGDALAQLHEATQRAAQERIDWYDRKASRFGQTARKIRFVALLLAGFGALAPLLSPLLEKLLNGRIVTITPQEADGAVAAGSTVQVQMSWIAELDTIGIVMVAVAGILVGFDNLFGISDSWMRYRTVQSVLIRRLATFKYEWAMTLTRLPPDPTAGDCTALLQSQWVFTDDIEKAVQSETNQWAARLRLRLSLFDNAKGFDRFEEETGSVEGSISNWEDVKSKQVALTVNAIPVAIESNGSFAVGDLPKGRHAFRLTVDGKRIEQQVEVTPGKTTPITIAALTEGGQ